jgi:methionyl-tRNA formyltransferase
MTTLLCLARALITRSGRRNRVYPLLTKLYSTDTARVLFLGTPDVAATSLRTIVEDSQKESSGYSVVGVVTQPPKRRKRKGKEIPSPVGYVAEELDIPVLTPEKAKDTDFLNNLENNIRPDLCITAAYGQYLPKRFLAIPKFGTVNIHPSLLPRWRGASPVQRSLQAGDNPVGVSVLFTVSKMDAGPIIAQKEYTVGKDDQATTVLPLLFEVGTELLLENLPDILSGKITMETAIQQDEALVTEASMINAAEAELRVWEESATTCHNRMRGFSMWPGTFLYLQVGDDEPIKVKIIETRVLPDSVEPTTMVELGPDKGDGLRLVCGDGSILEILTLQPVTRKAMDAKSFVNGIQGKTVKWVKPPAQ